MKKMSHLFNVIYLDLGGNQYITDINHLEKLVKLECVNGCVLADIGFCKLSNIIELNAHGNSRIKNLNFCLKLMILNISGMCGVTNKGVGKLLNIVKLDFYNNDKITNINHMVKITDLDCGSEISDEGMNCLTNMSDLLINSFNHQMTTECVECRQIRIKKYNFFGPSQLCEYNRY